MGGGLELTKRDEQGSEPSTLTCMDDEIQPLSGKPFFHVLLHRTHVNSPYSMGIPAKFARTLPSTTVPVILILGNRIWEMFYLGTHPTHKRFDPNWKAFAVDNNLKVGDICLFELLERGRTITFKVQILRGDFPSALLERRDGTEDRPVVID